MTLQQIDKLEHYSKQSLTNTRQTTGTWERSHDIEDNTIV